MTTTAAPSLSSRLVRAVLVVLEFIALLIGISATVAMGLPWLGPVIAVVVVAGLVLIRRRRTRNPIDVHVSE